MPGTSRPIRMSSLRLPRACVVVTSFALLALPALCALLACRSPLGGTPVPDHPDITLERVAFGSCALQGRPQPIWKGIRASNPDLFIHAGDNIYADWEDAATLRESYRQLGSEPEYRALRSHLRARGPGRLLSTWDDHDYGSNDGGADYALKDVSREAFFEFFEEPADSSRRFRGGVYDAHIYGPTGRRVQIILLDLRYFRSPLALTEAARKKDPKSPGPYRPLDDASATMLGPQQWDWLERELHRPAELRLLVSSLQLVAEEQPYEKWANMPRERERLLRLLARTGGTIILSGDRHFAELSAIPAKQYGTPIYDLTSSGLNRSWPGGARMANRFRVGQSIAVYNSGLISVRWDADPLVTMEIRGEGGATLLRKAVRLSELRARSP